jgi:hypothetical protein
MTCVGTESLAAAARTSHGVFCRLVCSTAHRLACCAAERLQLDVERMPVGCSARTASIDGSAKDAPG